MLKIMIQFLKDLIQFSHVAINKVLKILKMIFNLRAKNILTHKLLIILKMLENCRIFQIYTIV